MHTAPSPAWGLLFRSSIGRKFLVAGSAAFLAIFALGHTLGNLQVFWGPDPINRYAHHLQSLPYGILWIIRAVVLGAVLGHLALAVRLHAINRRSHGRGYRRERWLSATQASRSMMLSGAAILLFLILHILHFTSRSLSDFSAIAPWPLASDGTPTPNVYAMMYQAFSDPLVALLYVGAMALVALHLSHGVASLFQSVGWRNAVWRPRLERIARLYGLFVFLGLSSIPLAVLLDARGGVAIFDRAALVSLNPR